MLDCGSPVIHWLNRHDTCLFVRDFKQAAEHKTMKEERNRVGRLQIECLLPLKDGEDMTGVVLLGGKEKKDGKRSGYTEEEFGKCGHSSLTLAFLNVYDFKLYNQLYGNQERDQALVRIGHIIRDTVGDRGYCARCH